MAAKARASEKSDSTRNWFLGKWEHAFRRSDTRPESFQLTGAVPKNGLISCTEQADSATQKPPPAQLLEMRYAGGGLVFDILLPREAKSLDIDPGVLTVLAGLLGFYRLEKYVLL